MPANYSSNASGLGIPEWAQPAKSTFDPLRLGLPADERIRNARRELNGLLEKKVLNRVEAVINADPLVAFVYMSCAIDYLAGFWHGDESNPGRADYIGFVEKYFPAPQGRQQPYNAAAVYADLRCSLVHNLSLGETYQLKHNKPKMHRLLTDAGHVILNAQGFLADLVSAKDSYVYEVASSDALALAAFNRAQRGIVEIVPIFISGNRRPAR